MLIKCIKKNNYTLVNMATLVNKGVTFNYSHGEIIYDRRCINSKVKINDDLTISEPKVLRAFHYTSTGELSSLAAAKWVSFHVGAYISIDGHHVVYFGQVYVEGIGVIRF